MHSGYLAVIPMILAFSTACAQVNTEQQQPEPQSWLELDAAKFNTQIKQALSDKEEWPRSPLKITTVLLGDDSDLRELSLTEKKSGGENPGQSTITYVREGFLDDSVRGDWHELLLRRQADGSWQIDRARVAYRCWRGEHADTYRGALCP